MARYPGAVWRPVTRFNPGGSKAVAMTPRRFVFHTAVSDSPTLWPYFNQDGNPCSHFYVNETGALEQYVDTAYRAPANLEGNHDCISVESWDGAASPVPPWNAAQVATLRGLVAWVSATHGIPRSILPSSKTGLSGFGWHRQGIDPWRLSGTEYWSKSTGKICPGDAKIAQIPQIVGASPPPEEWEPPDMIVGQDQTDGKLYQVAGNTRLQLPGQVYATIVMGLTGQTVLQPFNHDWLMRLPDVYSLAAVTPPVDVDALAAALAPLLPPGVALTPDDVAAIAAAAAVTVNDELASRTSPPA